MNVVRMPELQADFEYARCLTKEYSKSFYSSASILPKDIRKATYAVYAFCRYVDNIIDAPRSRSRQEIMAESDAVRKEVEIAYRTGESQHPIIRPFVAVALEAGIPIEHPFDLIAGVEMDVEKKRYSSFPELYVFCYRVAAVVGLMMTRVFGCRVPCALAYAEKMGIAMQITNILRDVAEDASMGRIYLPEEDLSRFGVSEAHLLDGKFSPSVRDLVAYYTAMAEQYYNDATPGIGFLPKNTQYAVSSARRIYGGILPLIKQNDYNPFRGRVFVSSRTKAAILVQEVIKTKTIGYAPPAAGTCKTTPNSHFEASASF